MNFLGLCKQLRQEAGIPSNVNGPTSVAGQTGEMKRIVDWVNQSYVDILSMHETWRFMRAPFQFDLTVGSRTYSKAAVKAAAGLTNDIMTYVVHSLRLYLPSEGIESEHELIHVPDWDEFRSQFLLGPGVTTSGRPRFFSIDSGDNLVFNVLPDQAYRVYGDYVIEPAYMTADADVPLLPSWSHMIIVWYALLKYAGFEESSPQYTHAMNMYESMLNRLEMRELPAIFLPDPLA